MKNAIHMLKSVTDTIGNSFIIATETGKVAVMDGGFVTETDYFLEYLREVTGMDVPRIDAWFLSHPHTDHVSVFLEVIENRPSSVEIGTVYYNFPSIKFVGKEDGDAEKCLLNFYRLLPRFADKICVISGCDVYDVGEMRFEILYTADDEFRRNTSNNSSCVMKMTLGGKTAIFTGDCGDVASLKIVRMYGDCLKSDICQMSHHGQNGCEKIFYEKVSPKVCFWPTPSWVWNNDCGKGYNTHCLKTVEVRGWMDELGVSENYVAMNGTSVYEI